MRAAGVRQPGKLRGSNMARALIDRRSRTAAAALRVLPNITARERAALFERLAATSASLGEAALAAEALEQPAALVPLV